MPSQSKDYRDYVIKDGKFVGQFEKMYRDCEDPWHQDALRHPAEDLLLLSMRNSGARKILDIGCGKGALTGRILQETQADITAIDIAPTAIGIAQARYPKVRFAVMDALNLDFPENSFDITVVSELLWYVLPSLSDFFSKILRITIPDGGVCFIQQFYNGEEQKYGNNVMQTPDDLLKHLPFQVLQTVEFDRLRNYKLLLICKNVK